MPPDLELMVPQPNGSRAVRRQGDDAEDAVFRGRRKQRLGARKRAARLAAKLSGKRITLKRLLELEGLILERIDELECDLAEASAAQGPLPDTPGRSGIELAPRWKELGSGVLVVDLPPILEAQDRGLGEVRMAMRTLLVDKWQERIEEERRWGEWGRAASRKPKDPPFWRPRLQTWEVRAPWRLDATSFIAAMSLRRSSDEAMRSIVGTCDGDGPLIPHGDLSYRLEQLSLEIAVLQLTGELGFKDAHKSLQEFRSAGRPGHDGDRQRDEDDEGPEIAEDNEAPELLLASDHDLAGALPAPRCMCPRPEVIFRRPIRFVHWGADREEWTEVRGPRGNQEAILAHVAASKDAGSPVPILAGFMHTFRYPLVTEAALGPVVGSGRVVPLVSAMAAGDRCAKCARHLRPPLVRLPDYVEPRVPQPDINEPGTGKRSTRKWRPWMPQERFGPKTTRKERDDGDWTAEHRGRESWQTRLGRHAAKEVRLERERLLVIPVLSSTRRRTGAGWEHPRNERGWYPDATPKDLEQARERDRQWWATEPLDEQVRALEQQLLRRDPLGNVPRSEPYRLEIPRKLGEGCWDPWAPPVAESAEPAELLLAA
jgi:hypothetical protein